ncbi:acyltransferase [Chitinimonas sp.]|uniref:acyltransferase family protein n=1 Tax=Chitinimonas sp. TaxID=1934313 RepID=UPI0035B4565F
MQQPSHMMFSGRSTDSQRLAFLDQLKVMLTLLVIFHHAGQPYGPTGGEWPIHHAEKLALLGAFFHINASFFMGLFFLISGYFIDAAYQRKGVAAFLTDRFRQFGIPVMVFSLLFLPLIRHFKQGLPWQESLLPFTWAHLWFLGHLLVYATAFALYRHFFKASTLQPTKLGAVPVNLALLLYALALALVSTVVRLWFPIDRWVNIGVPAEVAHLPQYMSLFLIGIIAAAKRWLDLLTPAIGRLWLALAIALVAYRYTYQLYWVDMPELPGLLQGLPWCAWESLLCVAMCVGLIYLFRQHMNQMGPVSRFMSRHAFMVYVLHLPILVAVQRALERSALGPLALTVASGLLATLLSYAMAAVWQTAKAATADKCLHGRAAVN